MDKKNITIAILAGLVILGSLWGSVGNRNSKALRQELEEMKAELASVQVVSSQSHDAVLAKTAQLQKVLQTQEEQLAKARNELISHRRANKSLEAKLSERNAVARKLATQNKQLAARMKSAGAAQVAALQKKAGTLQAKFITLKNGLKAKEQQVARMQKAAAAQISGLQKENTALKTELKKCSGQMAQKISAAETAHITACRKTVTGLQQRNKQKDGQISELQAAMKKMQTAMEKMKQSAAKAQVAQQERPEPAIVVTEKDQQPEQARNNGCEELAKARAQIVGLEKIVEEKNAVVEEISRELDRVKINMDVLLSKIADQQDTLQEVQEENSELVKELAAKNEECADLQEQLQKVSQ